MGHEEHLEIMKWIRIGEIGNISILVAYLVFVISVIYKARRRKK